MDRALREFRIRGVSTNIDFVINLLKHPVFLTNQYSTKFIDTTPELFDFKKRRDRGTKVLTYIADITVNGHPEVEAAPGRIPTSSPPGPGPAARHAAAGHRTLLDEQGRRPSPTGCWRRRSC